jgi:ABC-type multidrug transport system fused ATPase/permease subunit
LVGWVFMKVILRLIGFVQKYWFMLVLAFICQILATAFGILIPRVLGQGIDDVIRLSQTTGSNTPIIIAAVIVVAAGALRGIAQYGNRYFSEVVSQKASYNIRNALYNRLQRLSFQFHDQNQTGQLMSRATVDVEATRMFFSMGLLGIAQVIMMFFGVVIMIMLINWQLALITIAFVIPVAWLATTFGRRIRPIWLKVQAMLGYMGTTLEESLAGIGVVKAFSRQKEESRKFTAQAKTLYDDQMSAVKLMAIIMPTMVLFVGVPTAVILWFGGNQVVLANMTVGQVTQFILYLGLLMMPIRQLGMMVNLYSRTVSAGQRILEILDTESNVKEKPNAVDLGRAKGQVTFENVSFSYDNISPALNNVSFEVQPGQLVALLGGSGSGKSTVANLLARFYDVTSGKILIDGVDIRDVKLSSLRSNVVTAQQDVFLFSSTIKENIAYGDTDADMDKIIEVAKAAQLHDFIEALPEGYDTWVGERGDTLSGGEKQRLSIARTLLVDPSVLILDDSTASVDSETERLIRQALNTLIQGRTTFIITHRLTLIKNADLILMFKDGELVQHGKHEELVAQEGEYKEVYESQLMIDQESKIMLEDN